MKKYTPTTEEGKKYQKELDQTKEAALVGAQESMNQEATEAIQECLEEMADIAAKAADELEVLRGKLTDLKGQLPTKTPELIALTEECLTALKDRNDTFTSFGKTAVGSLKKAIGLG